jgi:hypothetical protein
MCTVPALLAIYLGFHYFVPFRQLELFQIKSGQNYTLQYNNHNALSKDVFISLF